MNDIVADLIVGSGEIIKTIKAERGFSHMVRYDEVPHPQPQIGWRFKGKSFLSPRGDLEIVIENPEDII